MSEVEQNNNGGAGATQPVVFGQNGTGTPAPGNGGTGPTGPVPPAPGNGGTGPTGSVPPVSGNGGTAPTGSVPPVPGNGDSSPAALPDLAEYATNLFEGVEPESLDYQLFERARTAAHKAGIQAEALSAVMGDVQSFINETEAQIEQARVDSSNDQLKTLQQTDGNKFKAVMEACNNTLCNLAAEFGVDASVFNMPELRNNPEVVKFFYGLSERMKEAGFANVNRMASVATAEQELDSIYSGSHELSKAFFDSSDPNWQRAQDRVNELTKMTLG